MIMPPLRLLGLIIVTVPLMKEPFMKVMLGLIIVTVPLMKEPFMKVTCAFPTLPG